MKRANRFFVSSTIFVSVLFLCACLLVVVARSANSNRPNGATKAQTPQTSGPRSKKYLGRYQILANDPLQIDAGIKGVPFEFNKTLTTQDEDWLNELSLKVKNISSKTIVSFSLELWFPDTKAIVGNTMAHVLRYGGDPKVARQPIKERPLEPEEETTFDISGAEYASLKRFIENRVPMAYINSVQLHIGLVVFDDDTAWATGSFMRRDPHTGKWHDIQ